MNPESPIPLPHILLVDDERDIRDPLASYLAKNQLRVTKAEDAAAARQILAAHRIDLLLLDIMMPGEDGLSLAGFVRATTKVPIILLTAKAEETDRIVGLELGADDYVSKPFSPRELLARIRAVLRRAGEGATVHAPDAMAAFERSIDNHISRLRRKIEEDPADPKLIKTVWGGGYTLAADVRRL